MNRMHCGLRSLKKRKLASFEERTEDNKLFSHFVLLYLLPAILNPTPSLPTMYSTRLRQPYDTTSSVVARLQARHHAQ